MSSLKKSSWIFNRRRFIAGGAAVTGAAIAGVISPAQSRITANGEQKTNIITLEDQDLQTAIDNAPAHTLLHCRTDHPIIINKTVVIDKPLTLTGLRAHLQEGIKPVPLVNISSEGVCISDFELHGNSDWEKFLNDGRQSLLTALDGNFTIERGFLTKASQHGIFVRSDKQAKDIRHGVIRDIVVRDIGRDGVSLTGRPEGSISNILVENIYVYGSRLKGAVEGADGSDNIIFRNIYAEDCQYGADIMQDHGRPHEVMKNHTIESIHAVRCTNAIRTRNRDFGHAGLTIRDVTAENCGLPVSVSNVRGVLIDGVRVVGHEEDGPLVRVSNSPGTRISNVCLTRGKLSGEAIQLDRSDKARVDDLMDAR